MDDDKRRGKNLLKQSVNQWERNNSRQVDDSVLDSDRTKMTPPDYQMHLLDDPVEKPVLFSGVIGEVPAHMDITNRTDVLRMIDKGKKQKVIQTHVNYEYHAAIISLSAYDMKIMKGEETLLRIPMHEIAAMCYIKDDKQHILAVKFGTPEMCQLAVMYCDSKAVAEELCSLVENCFQMIYLKGVIGFFDSSIINNPSGSPSTGGSTTIPKAPSVSEFPNRPSSGSETRSETRSVSGKSIGGELLHDYMSKLHKELNPLELQQFAQILPDMEHRFPEFCERVLRLYGTERKHLLKEMMPFIPADNLMYFEDFLSRNGILMSEILATLSSSRTNLRTRRSIGEVSTTSSVSNNPTSDETLNHLFELTESQFNSVHVDTDPSKYVPNADY